jgi:hypothetical protein
MSYIIKTTSPFVSLKLTESGRESLSRGQLNFSYWAIGDSEINYGREAIVDANPNNLDLSITSKILRPFDRQPNIKSFVTTSVGEPLNTLNASNISVVKAVVNNKAKERGFFSGTTYETISGSQFTLGIDYISNTEFTGGTVLYITSAITVNVGDIIRIKLTNDVVLPLPLETQTPLPNLWFKVQATGATGSGTTAVTVDRNLPNISAQNISYSYVFVYKGGEVADAYGYDTSTAYWDSGTLSFDSATNITCDDVSVWNMNNVWCENLAGVTGLTTTKLYEDFTKFGSYSYLGTKNPYLEYLCFSDIIVDTDICSKGPNYIYVDDVVKSISILHYTNNTISNLYGEFLYLDQTKGKNFRVTVPNIMYHRRDFATGSGTTMGMSFISSGTTKFIGTSEIEYMDLIEDPTLVDSRGPKVVGKVFPQLKIATIQDDEIVAAMSYKSNRNWTLPALSAFLTSPSGGTTTGLLEVGKTVYLTYMLDNTTGTGLTTNLPCQTYIKVTNTTSGTKDVAFNLEDIDYLPYMRKIEDLSYDGYGFYAYSFKLLYQIVNNEDDRPDPGAWKLYDYTTTGLTTNVGETINPIALENQTPYTLGNGCGQSSGFVLTKDFDAIATTCNITSSMGLALNTTPDILQFGDERFFYGNIDTYIGATIYKTIFDVRINTSQYNLTTNPTRDLQSVTNPPNIKVTEVGIYDSNRELVVIGKFSEPVALLPGNTIMLELSMDF